MGLAETVHLRFMWCLLAGPSKMASSLACPAHQGDWPGGRPLSMQPLQVARLGLVSSQRPQSGQPSRSAVSFPKKPKQKLPDLLPAWLGSEVPKCHLHHGSRQSQVSAGDGEGLGTGRNSRRRASLGPQTKGTERRLTRKLRQGQQIQRKSKQKPPGPDELGN